MKHIKICLFSIVSGSFVTCVTSEKCCPGEFYVDGNVAVTLNAEGAIDPDTTKLFMSYEGPVRLYQTYHLCFETTPNLDGISYDITSQTKFEAEVVYASVDDVTYYPAADFVPEKIPKYVLEQIDKSRTIRETSPLQTVASTECSTILVADQDLDLEGVGLNTEASATKDVVLNFQTGYYGFTSGFTTLGYGNQQAGVNVTFGFNGTMFSGSDISTSSIHSDPHYAPWDAPTTGISFDFQGSCDQIAIDNPLLQMQIRTRPRGAGVYKGKWSGVTQVAVKWKPKNIIIFAFDHAGILTENDPGLITNNAADLTDIVSHSIMDKEWRPHPWNPKYVIKFPQSHRFTFLQGNITTNYIEVSFSALLDSYNIDVVGNALSFRNSVGVLGSWNDPMRFHLRDETTVAYTNPLSLPNIKSWQVLENESMLQEPSEYCEGPEECGESIFGCYGTLFNEPTEILRLFNEPTEILSEPEHCGLSCADIENAMMRKFCKTDVEITNNTMWACQMSYLDPVHKYSEPPISEPPTTSPIMAPTKEQSPTSFPTVKPMDLSTLPTSKPSTSPSSKISSVPTSLFAGQNFEIGKPQSRFNDNLGNFSVPLNYTEVGHSVDFLSVTLRKAGCDKPVNDPVITMNKKFFEKTEFDTPSVSIDTTEFTVSSLVVNKSQGESIGVLKFCVRAEGFDGDIAGDNVSVSFRQDDISVAYDLTNNSFTVEDNKITADEIMLSENNVTASYSVDAFRCSTDYVSDGTSSTILKQNDIVYVCIKPVNTSVYISDFDMVFWQDEAEKYTAVSVGVKVNPLSQLSTGGTDGKTKRVASRVISKFFEGEANPFVVKGNAFLSFSSSTDSRRLRSVQDSSQVGEGSFEMEVGLEKGVSSSTARRSSITKGGTVLCVIGGILSLSIGMVVYKKMRA